MNVLYDKCMELAKTEIISTANRVSIEHDLSLPFAKVISTLAWHTLLDGFRNYEDAKHIARLELVYFAANSHLCEPAGKTKEQMYRICATTLVLVTGSIERMIQEISKELNQ